jgi:hypothetical protein
MTRGLRTRGEDEGAKDDRVREDGLIWGEEGPGREVKDEGDKGRGGSGLGQ